MADLGTAYVQIVPSAEGIQKGIEDSIEGSSGGVSKSLGSMIKKGVVAAGIGKVLKESITQGADLQQSIGGVETLFKGASDAVISNANNAFSSAGLSANDYMETVTSFAASMVGSLGGDVQQAAKLSDQAVRDMSDNSNKMGTDMQSIMGTYQSLARGNYGMLDNLKLGYGGTKAEMQRLLSDAEKLTGKKFDISNFSDVTEAIHAVQTEMGITGTTASEAATTVSGSASMMKASWENLLGGMAMGFDMGPLLDQFGNSIITFANNVAPMISSVFSTLPGVLVGVFSAVAPQLP